jgi:group I intron endonuclease
MSLKKAKENNPLFGKKHSEETKELMREKALAPAAAFRRLGPRYLPPLEKAAGPSVGRKHSEDTKLLMSSKHGNSVNIYEKSSSKGFELIGSFVSARRAGKFLEISGSTVVRYMKSGEIFKDRYKFSPR